MATVTTARSRQRMRLSRILTLTAIVSVVAISFAEAAKVACSAELSPAKLERGRTFYWHIADNSRGTSLETQIRSAMQNNASQQDYVFFEEVQTPVSTFAYGIQFKTSNLISSCAKATLQPKSGAPNTLVGATIEIRSTYTQWGGNGVSASTMQRRGAAHEVTHGLGQDDNSCHPSESVMANVSWTNPATGTTGNLTTTDGDGINSAYVGGGGGDSPDNPPGGNSPIIIDLNGDGFRLTSRSAGVVFDLNNDGDANRIAWTAADSDDGFLALDRNGNGTIDDGVELFGDRSPLHDGVYAEHGFEALRFFDQAEQGGYQDGYIDASDSIYTELRVWVDRNHNGLSEPEELFTLPEVGIARIALDYIESGRRDRYGNYFRFCAGTYREGEPPRALGNRQACDVFFVGGEE